MISNNTIAVITLVVGGTCLIGILFYLIKNRRQKAAANTKSPTQTATTSSVAKQEGAKDKVPKKVAQYSSGGGLQADHNLPVTLTYTDPGSQTLAALGFLEPSKFVFESKNESNGNWYFRGNTKDSMLVYNTNEQRFHVLENGNVGWDSTKDKGIVMQDGLEFAFPK